MCWLLHRFIFVVSASSIFDISLLSLSTWEKHPSKHKSAIRKLMHPILSSSTTHTRKAEAAAQNEKPPALGLWRFAIQVTSNFYGFLGVLLTGSMETIPAKHRSFSLSPALVSEIAEKILSSLSESSAPSGRTLGAKRSTNPWISMNWIGLDWLNSLIQ